jgi:pimeloyl-ACP methyl ester carboxylesterase
MWWSAAAPAAIGRGRRTMAMTVARTGQEHWVSLSSSSRPVPVDDTGHNIQVDQPDVVIQQIEGLLP